MKSNSYLCLYCYASLSGLPVCVPVLHKLSQNQRGRSVHSLHCRGSCTVEMIGLDIEIARNDGHGSERNDEEERLER